MPPKLSDSSEAAKGDPQQPWPELVSGAELDQHIGRLVEISPGKLYEVLRADATWSEEFTIVWVPESRLADGRTDPLSWFKLARHDEVYVVVDAPTDFAARTRLISAGHHLVPPPGDTVALDQLLPEPLTEMVTGENLHEHIGRLVALHRGRMYEILGVGPLGADDVERDVIVPAPRFNLLNKPNPTGTTMTIRVFADVEFPVADAPTDRDARTELVRNGHHVMQTERTATWSGSPDFHLTVARSLDMPNKAVWAAAMANASDLLALKKIDMSIAASYKAPPGLDIIVSTGPAVGIDLAVARVLRGLRDAGYESVVETIPLAGPDVRVIRVTLPVEITSED